MSVISHLGRWCENHASLIISSLLKKFFSSGGPFISWHQTLFSSVEGYRQPQKRTCCPFPDAHSISKFSRSVKICLILFWCRFFVGGMGDYRKNSLACGQGVEFSVVREKFILGAQLHGDENRVFSVLSGKKRYIGGGFFSTHVSWENYIIRSFNNCYL